MYRLSLLSFLLFATSTLFATDPKKEVEDYATIYVMRSNDNHQPVASHINVNGDFYGSTYGETYLVLRLPEGLHSISSRMSNLSDLELNVEASKTYFIQQKVNAQIFTPKNKLVRVDASKGLELMWMCKAVK